MVHKKVIFIWAQLLFIISLAAAHDPTPIPADPQEEPIPVVVKSRTPIPEQHQRLMEQFHRVPKERYTRLERDYVSIDGTQVVDEQPVRLELRYKPARKWCPKRRSKKSQADEASCRIRPPGVQQTLIVRRTYRIVDREKFVAFKKRIRSGAAGFMGTLLTLGLGAGAFVIGTHLADKHGRKAEREARRTPIEFTKIEEQDFYHPLPLVP